MGSYMEFMHEMIRNLCSAVRTDSNTWKFILYEDIYLNTLHLGLNSLFEWLCCIFYS